jgi:hypothetical protein
MSIPGEQEGGAMLPISRSAFSSFFGVLKRNTYNQGIESMGLEILRIYIVQVRIRLLADIKSAPSLD